MKTLALSCLIVATIAGSMAGSAVSFADDTAAKPAVAPAATPAPAATATPAATAAPAAAPAAKPATGPLTNAEASYRIGLSLGEQLKHAGIAPDALKTDELARGVKDAVHGTGHLTPEEGKRLNDWVLKAASAIADKNHAVAKAFLDKNGKLPGVVTTASGLEYQVVTAGKGASPKPTDEVTVQYRGTTLDGKEFDSSYKRGQPATFPVTGVIKGWQEALVLMQPGAKWKLFIPPELAYDLKSPTPLIPPGSALVFDVELVSINVKPQQ